MLTHLPTWVDLRLIAPSLFAFTAVLAFVFGVIVMMKARNSRQVRDRLHDVVADRNEEGIDNIILRDMELSSVPWMNRLLKGASWARRLDMLLVQADVKMRVGAFVMLTCALGIGSALIVDAALKRPYVAAGAGVFMALIPLFVIRHKKQARTLKFEEQFPDALDMLTSALRAGLALTAAIQVVADEAPDPVGKEFRVLFEENRLGVDMKHAVRMMAERVDSTEARLFATALILQRETGGNLAEVLDGTAAVIRDRFRILRDVRTLTAQARLSGGILMLLPLAMAGIIMVLAPDYLRGLAKDPVGHYLIPMALTMQVVGFVIMRRIVDIKV
ncbi:MAG TPA: type II secretion system F family protein [Candidatus Krumholzibacteria bacterium]|nr:type II secretion system F family protein [Candidatus Krumholzibacteria bacterium]